MSSAAEIFDRIKVPSAYQLVADAIEAEIVAGRLQPGDEIGTEAELVRQFGVNRSTVREGIRVLEQGGLVQREAGRRLYVCPPQVSALSSRMSRAMVLAHVTFRELYETTMVLQLAGIEGAVAHAEESDLAALEGLQAQMIAALADPIRLCGLHTEFHASIARASRNRVLELAREPAALLFFPTTELICRRVPEGPGRIVAAHRHMIDAIRARDAEMAALWMRRHVNDWRKGFERAGGDMEESVERMFTPQSLRRIRI